MEQALYEVAEQLHWIAMAIHGGLGGIAFAILLAAIVRAVFNK